MESRVGLFNVDLNNRMMWLCTTAMVLIILITCSFGNSVLFLAGAVGGIFSVMWRIPRTPPKITEWQTSWAPLFLSPLVGALMGWIGVAIATILHIRILDIEFSLNEPVGLAAFGLAILSGLSEQIFNRLLSQAMPSGASQASPPQMPSGASQAPPPKSTESPEDGEADAQTRAPDGEANRQNRSGDEPEHPEGSH